MKSSGTFGWPTMVVCQSAACTEHRRALLTLVTSHVHVRVSLDMLGQQVAQSVIFLLQNEVGGVGHAWTFD